MGVVICMGVRDIGEVAMTVILIEGNGFCPAGLAGRRSPAYPSIRTATFLPDAALGRVEINVVTTIRSREPSRLKSRKAHPVLQRVFGEDSPLACVSLRKVPFPWLR